MAKCFECVLSPEHLHRTHAPYSYTFHILLSTDLLLIKSICIKPCLYFDTRQRFGMAALCKIQLQNEAARIVTGLTRSGLEV